MNCRVMVVDENAAFRNVIVNVIAQRGFEAYPAADGIDALRQIYEVMPKVIVADAVLPDLSGFRFLPFVRRRFPDIAVIAMKGESNAYNSGAVIADKVFHKNPFNLDRFLQSIEELSKDGRQSRCRDPRCSHQRMIEAAENEVARMGSQQCAGCETLLRLVNEALLNSLLTVTWQNTNPEEASQEQAESAERMLGRALGDLNAHKREAHNLERAG